MQMNWRQTTRIHTSSIGSEEKVANRRNTGSELVALACTRHAQTWGFFWFFFVFKVAAELRQADAEACVLCRKGMGGGSADTLPPLLAGRDTDVREQKFPREKRADSAHFSALHHETHFVRARVFNWLRILTSLHAFSFCPQSLDMCCERRDPECADGVSGKRLSRFYLQRDFGLIPFVNFTVIIFE